MSKRIFPILALALSLAACSAPQRAVEVTLSEQELYDKIRGGWAGQTIGVVFGAPTEFKFTGTTIQDYQPIPWSEHYVKYWWDKKPGLFDDIYNDLTFVETFEQEGLDCRAASPLPSTIWHTPTRRDATTSATASCRRPRATGSTTPTPTTSTSRLRPTSSD